MKTLGKLSLLFFFFSTTMLIAQAPSKAVLVAKDLDTIIANYAALQADFEAFGDKYDTFLDVASAMDSPTTIMENVRSLKIPAEIKAVFKKYGLGDNGFEKLMVITMGTAGLVMDTALAEQLDSPEMTEEMLPYFDSVQSMIDGILGQIHEKDLKLIFGRLAELSEVLGVMDNMQ